MSVVSITPAVRVISEEGLLQSDIIYKLGDNVKIEDGEHRIFKGILLYLKMSTNRVDNDVLIIDIGGENIEIPVISIIKMNKVV